jgi:ABC-type ATPase with predicted acetyltransferase domain
MTTSRAGTPDRSRDDAAQVAFALLTAELAAWRCLRCGSVCCVTHSQPSVCSRCGTRYLVQG